MCVENQKYVYFTFFITHLIYLVHPNVHHIFDSKLEMMPQEAVQIRLTELLHRTLLQHPELEELVMFGIVKYIQSYTQELESGVNTVEFMEGVYAKMDELYDQMDKSKITCKKGCSACCNFNVSMTILEAKAIRNYVKVNKVSVDKEVFEKQLHLGTDERYFSPHSRCAFLSAEGTCNIYPVRPMHCRKYLVNSDPAICFEPPKPALFQLDVEMEVMTSALINCERTEFKPMAEHMLNLL